MSASGQSLAIFDIGDSRIAVSKMSPHFFGDKWREGMKQTQTGIKHAHKCYYCLFFSLCSLQLSLRDLHIPICEVTPDEFINLLSSLSILETLDLTFHIADELLQFCPDPTSRQESRSGPLTADDGRSSTVDGPSSRESIALITNLPAFQILFAKLRLDFHFLGAHICVIAGR